jgi:hypothetical protein
MHRDLVSAAAVVATACSPAEPSDAVCPEPSGFVNHGCGEIVGAVTDRRGAPVTSGYAGWFRSERDANVVGEPVVIQPDGRFRYRVWRWGEPAAGPDTVSGIVHASTRVLVGVPARDTTVTGTGRVVARLAPPGAVPPVTDVGTIVIPLPPP